MTDTVGASVEQAPVASPGASGDTAAPEAPPRSAFDEGALSDIYDEIAGIKDEAESIFPEEKFTGENAPEDDDSEVSTTEEDADETVVEDDDQSQTEDDEQKDEKAGQPETPSAIERPQSWSPESDALWKQLPPDAQELIAKRESESQQQISRMGNDLATFKPLGELLGQHRAMFERNGLDAVNGVKTLLEAQQMLEMDPVGGLAAIAGRFGLNRVQLAQALTGRQVTGEDGKNSGPIDPAMLQIQSEVTGLKQQLAEAKREQLTWREQQERAAQQQTDHEVAKWAEGKPYFDEARTMMGNLIMAAANQGQVLSLDDAYDQAVHALPALRAKVQAEAKAKDVEKRKQAASQAKRSGAVNAGTTRPTRPAPGGKWDDPDALAHEFDRIAAAG
jgi:hypothetical protein